MTGNDPAPGDRSAVLRDNKGNVQTGDHSTAIFIGWPSRVTPAAEGNSPPPRRRETIGLPPQRSLPRPAGRSRELELITRAVDSRVQVIVTGPPGSGKSTVVREAAVRVHAQGHPVVFLDAAGQRLGDVLQQVFEACYHSESYKPGPGRLRELLTGIEFCLVIDHLTCNPQEWASLLQAVPHAAVVAAMPPGDLPSGPLQLIPLGGLDRDAALALIAEHTGVEIGPRNLEAAEAVWQATSGLPGPLVMAAAAAARGPDGGLDFPPLDTIPQPALDRLSAAEREIVMLLALAGPGSIAPQLLTELAIAGDHTNNPLGWLTRQGLVTSGQRGLRLASGVADRLSPDLRPAPADAERISSALTSWAGSPATAPRAVADHATLINAVIDLTVSTGHPGRAASLAQAASPALAISLRHDAWEDILAHGINAARQAHDQATEAYLTHETGVLRLITGAPQRAALPLAHAARMWDYLSRADLATDAWDNLARNGLKSPYPAPVPVPSRRRRRPLIVVLLCAAVAVIVALIVSSLTHAIPQIRSGLSLIREPSSFYLLGTSCESGGQGGDGVLFLPTGPAVLAGASGADIALICANRAGGGVAGFMFSDMTTRVKGMPTSSQCVDALKRGPAVQTVKFKNLAPHDAFCMENDKIPGDHQLILAVVNSVDDKTYTTNWTATEWGLPGNLLP